MKSLSPTFFEHLVLDLMLKMGYGGSRDESGLVTNPGADEGIDGIINEDQLGLDVIYLQAKRWENSVGRPEIQRFVGALHGRRAKKGVFLTTSTFTQDARDYVATIDPKVVLIDGLKLAQLMIDFGVGVSRSQIYEIKRIDSDYFDVE
ncbi:MAG: restriction endonuclease [Planctomycetaceae bacterium]